MPFEQFWQDLRYAARSLVRAPAFAIPSILILALAIGANTAVFSVIEGVLLRALPYRDSERLCVLWKSVPKRNIEWDWTSYPTIRDWREQSNTFEDLAMVLRPEGSMVTLRSEAGRERIQGSKVYGNFFELLGVQPLLGRTFSSGEQQRGESVAVLSYGFWKARFGGSTAAIGRTLQLDDRSTTIIGVMPPSFQFPDKRVQLWLPLAADPRWPLFQRFRISDAFCALVRLKPGRSIEHARAEMNAVAARLARQYPATDRDLGIRVVPLFDQITGARTRQSLWALAAAVFCVMLIACSNVAGLLLARGTARGRELAVRAALGAGRTRLLWQLASENILLSLAGGVAGVWLAHAGLDSLLALAPADLPRSSGIGINGVVLAFNFGICLLTGIAFGLPPAAQAVRAEPAASLRNGGRSASAGPRAHRVRGLLVTLQFAFAVALLAGAGLLIRSFLLLNAFHPGFDTRRLLTVSLELPAERYKSAERRQAVLDDTVGRIAALPGARGEAGGSAVFGSFREHAPNQNILVEGQPVTPDAERHGREIVSDNYFRVLGIALRAGRVFSGDDVPDGPRVAVINETMARRLWPGQSAVGKRFKEMLPGTDAPWMTVVGVVEDIVYNRDGSVAPVFYAPVRQWSLTSLDLVVRTEGNPQTLAGGVRRAIESADPILADCEIATVEHRLEDLDRPRMFQTRIIGGFASLAVILAAAGLYGLMAYSVEQRTREIGIRVAL